MDLWSSGELSEEKLLNRICKVEGCWYGVRDVRCLTKSGVHSYGSVTNDFLPMVVSAVIACHPFLFRECVRSVSEGVGSSDRSVVV
ncbi:hypothetical protein YC2023_087091 [Brassica napus]